MTVDKALEYADSLPHLHAKVLAAAYREQREQLRRLRSEKQEHPFAGAQGAKATFTDKSVHPAVMAAAVEIASTTYKALRGGGLVTIRQAMRPAITAALPHLLQQTGAEGDDMTAELRRELDTLRDLCGAAYQAAGASGWPVEWLDNLSDAANGDPLRHDVAGLLPFFAPDDELQRDAERLDWLDTTRENVVSGYGDDAELVAHAWCVQAQRMTVREAIDDAMAETEGR